MLLYANMLPSCCKLQLKHDSRTSSYHAVDCSRDKTELSCCIAFIIPASACVYVSIFTQASLLLCLALLYENQTQICVLPFFTTEE